MTTSNEDFFRRLSAEALDEVPRLREVKGLKRGKLLRFTRDRTYHWLNEGVRDETQLRTLVLADVNKEFSSFILLMILAGVVSFCVQRILERLFPKTEENLGK